jgi:RNA polymerase sigma-70 factor, ECF subfamily
MSMNSEEFKKLYFHFYNKLYRLALRILSNSNDAEDAVQEVYIKLWNIREKLMETSNPEAYAITIIKNHCIDKLKLNHTIRFNDIQHGNHLSEENNPLEQIVQKDNNYKLLKIIELLPEPFKKIIILRDIENLSFDEIQDITGYSTNNIRVCLSRARKKVRDEFLKFHNYGSERNKETSGQIL